MPVRRKLTVLGINNLNPPQKGRKEVFDTDPPQLCLRVTSKGARSFAVRLRVKGQPKHIRCTRPIVGRIDGSELTAARNWARGCLKDAKLGIDPNAEAKKQLRERRKQDANTFKAVADEYIREYMKANRLKSTAETERILGKYVYPYRSKLLIDVFGDTPITEIGKDVVRALLNQVECANGLVMRNRTLAAVRQVFNWALEEKDALTATPISRKMARKEYPRDRVLKDDELTAIWAACEGLGWPYGSFYRVLLLLGQRRGETARMKWDHLDLESREWTIPADETKNGVAHLVPLAEAAQTLIAEIPRPARPKGPYVFSTTDGEKPINGFQPAKQRLDKASEVSDWTVHDIRRTVRTGLAKIGIPDTVAERVVNHLPGGVVKIYNVHDYAKEKADALDRWADHLRAIVDVPSEDGAEH